MSIKDVKIKWSLGDGTRQEAENFGSEVSGTSGWTVIVTKFTDDQFTVLKARGLPAHHETNKNDSSVWCARLRVTNTSPLIWEVQADWEPVKAEGQDGQSQRDPNPLTAEPKASWGWSASEEAVDMDAMGRPTLNTAGEGFDPPLSKTISDRTLTLVRNERQFDIAKKDIFKDTIAKEAIFKYGKRTARMIDLSGSFVIEGKYRYWEVTYVIHFRKDGWETRVLNQGYREAVTLANKKRGFQVITDKDGKPFNTPSLLKLDGTAYTPDEVLEAKNDFEKGTNAFGLKWERHGIAIFLFFDMYTAKSWSTLSLRLPRQR